MIQDIQDGLAALLADLVVTLLRQDDVLDVRGKDAEILDHLGARKRPSSLIPLRRRNLRLAKEFNGQNARRKKTKVWDLFQSVCDMSTNRR